MSTALLETDNWKLPSRVAWRITLNDAAEAWLRETVRSACADWGVTPAELFALPRRKTSALARCRIQIAVSMLDHLAMIRDSLGTTIELSAGRTLAEYSTHRQMELSRISVSATARILGVVPSTLQHVLGPSRGETAQGNLNNRSM